MCACCYVSVAPPPLQVLGDSVLLASAGAGTIVAAFQRELSLWLPRMTRAALLYRGSDHGMTPAAFHSRCDGKGPTLVLVRSDNGYTFGGYTSTAWTSGNDESARCPDAFLFSVVGPYGSVAKFPLRPGCEGDAIVQFSKFGPYFGRGGDLFLQGIDAVQPFTGNSRCDLTHKYTDTLGHGKLTLTGTPKFTPQDIEVYAVL